MSEVFQVEYAGHPIRYSFLCPAVRYMFRGGVKRCSSGDYDIGVTPELMELGKKLLPDGSNDAYVEYRLLIELTALKLLRYGCCIFHSAAIVFRGRAWLLTAPSGTGKTTQFLNWQRMFPDETEMLCGDMPVIERRAEEVFVHFSSWCGKEHYGTPGLSAPLGGIVFLEQAKENRLTDISSRDAMFRLFEQFMCRPDTEEQAIALAALADSMLRRPLLRFENLGDDNSTKMLRDAIVNIGDGKERSWQGTKQDAESF